MSVIVKKSNKNQTAIQERVALFDNSIRLLKIFQEPIKAFTKTDGIYIEDASQKDAF